jgi:hypothetical protein
MKMVANSRRPIPYEIIEDDTIGSEKKPEPSFRDFLRFVAMRQSLSMAQEYETLSGRSPQEKQKTFFLDMANLKHGEYERLRRYTADGRMVSLTTKNRTETTLWPAHPGSKRFVGLEDACRFAMNKELGIYCLYLRLADLEEELVTKRLFLFLVRIHKSSLNYVQNRLQLITILSDFAGNEEAVAISNNYSSAQIA